MSRSYPQINDCPICSHLNVQTHKKCSHIVENGEYIGVGCRNAFKLNERSIDHPKFKPNGSLGPWKIYFLYKTATTAKVFTGYSFERLVKDSFEIKTQGRPLITSYSVDNSHKDQLYRSTIAANGLSIQHTQYLQERGIFKLLSVREARKRLQDLGFISLHAGVVCPTSFPDSHPLPGFSPNGSYYLREGGRKRSINGIGIPKLSGKGEILSWQIKPDNGKYIYALSSKEEIEKSGQGFQTKKHDTRTGRIPLSVVTFSENPYQVIYTEGVLKPIITAYRNSGSIVIGGEGSLICRPDALNYELLALEKRFPDLERTVLIAPDAKTAFTSLSALKIAVNAILECGWNYQILDWGQIFDHEKVDPELGDPDEVSSAIIETADRVKSLYAPKDLSVRIGNKLVTYEEDQCVFKDPEEIRREIEDPKARFAIKPFNARPYQGSIVNRNCYSTKTYLETVDFLEQALKKKTVIANLSPPGTGKSYALVTLAERTDYKFIHISSTPSTVSLPEIQQWKRSAIRNAGFHEDQSKLDCLGNPVLKPIHEDRDEGNCKYTGLIQDIHSKTGLEIFQSYKFCSKSCPMFKKCKSSSGPGYGYLFEKEQDKDERFLRSHIFSLPPDLDNTVVFIDELSRLDLFKSYKAPFGAINDLLEQVGADSLHYVTDLISALSKALEADKKLARYGISGSDFLEIASKVFPQSGSPEWDVLLSFLTKADADKAEEQERAIKVKQATKDSKKAIPVRFTWFFYLMIEVNRFREGNSAQTVFSMDPNMKNLTVTVTNTKVLDALTNAPYLIVNDATARIEDVEFFCSLLGERQWTIVRQDLPKSSQKRQLDLQYYQIKDINLNASHSRLPQTQEKIINTLSSLQKVFDPKTTAVIDFKKFAQDYKNYNVFLNHLGDARGSNSAETLNSLIIIGNPRENRTSVLTRFLLYTAAKYGEYTQLDVDKYCFLEESKETHQEIHRLRANKRQNDTLQILFISQESYQWLDPDLEFIKISDAEYLDPAYVKTLPDDCLEEIDAQLQPLANHVETLYQMFDEALSAVSISDWGSTMESLNQDLVGVLSIASDILQDYMSKQYLEKGSETLTRVAIKSAKSEIKNLNSYLKILDNLFKFEKLVGYANTPILL